MYFILFRFSTVIRNIIFESGVIKFSDEKLDGGINVFGDHFPKSFAPLQVINNECSQIL